MESERQDVMLTPFSRRLAAPALMASIVSVDAFSLLAVSLTCSHLRGVLDGRRTWEALLWRNHHVVLSILFEGCVPPPRGSNTWKQHYFDFAWSWKTFAQQRMPGRILLKMHSSATAPKGTAKRHRFASGDGGSYGVYDATIYAPSHPGLDQGGWEEPG